MSRLTSTVVREIYPSGSRVNPSCMTQENTDRRYRKKRIPTWTSAVASQSLGWCAFAE